MTLDFTLTPSERHAFDEARGGPRHEAEPIADILHHVERYGWTFLGGAGAELLHSDLKARDPEAHAQVVRLFALLQLQDSTNPPRLGSTPPAKVYTRSLGTGRLCSAGSNPLRFARTTRYQDRAVRSGHR